MPLTRIPRAPLVLVLAGATVAALTLGAAARPRTHQITSQNPSGTATTLSTRGPIDLLHPFFRSIGTNGRACSTCHDPADGWTTTPERLKQRFEASGGLDPVFRAHDGANSPNADTNTVEARRTAYSMLLERGVFRIGLPIPENAEFTLESVDDPYGYASATELSLFRRCLPATNLRFNSTIMWDGRETHPGATLAQNLASQAQGAHKGHAQGTTPLTDQEVAQIVDFEAGLFTAQTKSAVVNKLGKKAGPKSLTRTRFVEGMNSPFPTGKKSRFQPEVFKLFKSWRKLPKTARGLKGNRRLIARGEQIFNSREFIVSDVAGFNDVLGNNNVVATCSTCHNTPNVGSLSLNLPMDIGVKRIFRRSPEEPLYTLRNKQTGETRSTTDPGRALVTGKWEDVEKFKVPGLRGLASRAPYFHDGSAKTIEEVVEFYYDRFALEAGPAEKEALAAFLKSL